MVLVPQTVDAVKIPVIAAGGIYDGRGMAAALTMGAEGVQIGTRFAATIESSAHDHFKQAMVNSSPTDTFLILRKLIPARVIKNSWFERIFTAEKEGATEEELLRIIGEKRTKIGMFEGDMAEGELQIGQAVGAIKDLPSAGALVLDIARDCERIIRTLPAKVIQT
jgi:enoyl-[acyl-carrier protein] reductase II